MTGSDKSSDSSRQHRRPGSRRRISLSVRSLAPLLNYLSSLGHSLGRIPAAAAVQAIAQDPEARVPHTQAIALWEAARTVTADPDLGIHVAEAIRPGAFGALEYAVRTSPDLGAGLGRLVRYHRALHDAAEVRLEVSGTRACLSHRLPLPGGAPRAVSEFVVTGWLQTLRRLTGREVRPIEVRFTHAQPADLSEHHRVFRAPLRFGHQRSELLFPAELLGCPLPEADPALHSIVELQLNTVLERLPAAGATVDRVRRVLAEELCDGEPTLDHVAGCLHVTSRTLHRRLEEEGTSFREVVTAVRRELAERYLGERRLTVAEIAFLLGYSEASAFHRAFRRWNGCSPRAFRAGH